jgi:hypothetical protein
MNEKYYPCHALGIVGKPLISRGASSFRKMDYWMNLKWVEIMHR